jgi:hypothetical protein
MNVQVPNYGVEGFMEAKKLLAQVSRPVLNVGAMFDIPTGKIEVGDLPSTEEMLNGGKVLGYMLSHRPLSGRSTYLMNLLEKGIAETKGGTPERFRYACNLFGLLGFAVKWAGTLEVPEVTWMDTEGWSEGWDVAAFIRKKLYEDVVPDKPDHELLGEHFYAQVQNLQANQKHRVCLIDSVSDMD